MGKNSRSQMLTVLINVLWITCGFTNGQSKSALKNADRQISNPIFQVDLPKNPILPEPGMFWVKNMKGAISSLSASENGEAILVATSPDSDIAGTANHPLLTWIDSKGNTRWERRLIAPIREQDISPDASFAVISNYSDQIQKWSPNGEVLWTVSGNCRPHILFLLKQIICYHDDDGGPRVAFDLLDEAGKKLYSHSIQKDVLALKISSDQKRGVMGLTDGNITLFQFQTDHPVLWNAKVEGEIIDVAVAPGDRIEVAVLYRTSPLNRKLALFDEKARPIAQADLPLRPFWVEYTPSGNHLYYYGNGQDGQIWGVLSRQLEFLKSQRWSFSAEYSYPAHLSQKGLLVGFEELGRGTKRSHLLYLDDAGQLKLDLLLAENSEAYLYAYRMTKNDSVAVVATDDGKVARYQLMEKP